MNNIKSSEELKNAIIILEEEQSVKLLFLKEQFYVTYDGLKPINLLKKTISEISSSPLLMENIVTTATGMVTGYLSKKIFVGTSGGAFRRLIGSILQFGVTNIVTHHPDTVKSVGKFIFEHLFKKKTNQNPQSDN